MSSRLPADIAKAVESSLNVGIKNFLPASGGCINFGGKLATSAGDLFIKWNDAKSYPQMFAAEARGLVLLSESTTLAVPKVIHNGAAGQSQFLVLEYVEAGRRSQNFWQELGTGLAAMHRHSAETFGLDHNNYIGSLPQHNTPRPSWIEFFASERILPQLQRATDAKKVDRVLRDKVEFLLGRLADWLPEEQPALVHGDLWNGNLMVSATGGPCLIDPAVYYGHREADLAMMKLFGGFAALSFDAYEEVYPLAPGFSDRVDLYNLYPLLVHVNLFGGGYRAQVASIVDRFG